MLTLSASLANALIVDLHFGAHPILNLDAELELWALMWSEWHAYVLWLLHAYSSAITQAKWTCRHSHLPIILAMFPSSTNILIFKLSAFHDREGLIPTRDQIVVPSHWFLEVIDQSGKAFLCGYISPKFFVFLELIAAHYFLNLLVLKWNIKTIILRGKRFICLWFMEEKTIAVTLYWTPNLHHHGYASPWSLFKSLVLIDWYLLCK